MKNDDHTQTENQETPTTQTPPSPKKDKEWIAWRKAKRDGRLTEHRKMLKSSAYRKMKKSEANQQDRERSK
ncbi:hypothetical protein MNB_SV-3-1337 [hydrothermal vent metagenome]|uniref:Uncharacterized protein n=1 Tax=hydrothermal vent metagenome TaxID=652676 RepID=A0A1W1CQB1_9ZZZZ